MRELIKIFKALSDKTRIRMLKLLQQRELCVCEIMQAMGISQTRASRNLGVLKNAGLVTDKREGLWVHYSINKEKLNEYHAKIENIIRGWLNNDSVVVGDMERLGRAVKMSKPCRRQ